LRLAGPVREIPETQRLARGQSQRIALSAFIDRPVGQFRSNGMTAPLPLDAPATALPAGSPPADVGPAAVREAMEAGDAVLRLLGLRVEAVALGQATVAMPVRAEMLNGFGICHGGLVATLADTAFAYACNAQGELTVASGFGIDLLAPAHEGDLLTAEARELSRSGRTGLYDITVRNQRGETVAVFRGRSYTLKGRPVIGTGRLSARSA
jgi:acyl-CoA thioesterase